MSTKAKRVLFVLIFSAVLVFICLYIIQRYNTFQEKSDFYITHFLPGTVVNQTDLSNMTSEEAEALLIPDGSDYSIAVKFKNNQQENISAQDIDYHYTDHGQISSILANQAYLFFGDNKGEESNMEIEPVYDVEKCKELILQWPELQQENMTEAVGPELTFTAGAFFVSDVQQSTVVIPDQIVSVVQAGIDNKKDQIDLTAEEGIYTYTDFSEETNELQKEADKLNKICAASITYDLPTGTQVLDGMTLKEWLIKDDKGNYKKDNEKWHEHVVDYVNAMADQTDNVGSERVFAATGLGNITVRGGTYGYTVDREAEIAQLEEELNNESVAERQPIYTSWETSTENNGFGNSYVEIDLSRQHLWTYVNGEMILETDIVSGLPTENRYTPEGIYLVYFKESPSILVGEKNAAGVPEYKTSVSFWMPFNEGIGMHDATWQPYFGGDRWIEGGSHGCINMPYDMAEQMYNIITYDMPIICYYSAGSPF